MASTDPAATTTILQPAETRRNKGGGGGDEKDDHSCQKNDKQTCKGSDNMSVGEGGMKMTATPPPRRPKVKAAQKALVIRSASASPT